MVDLQLAASTISSGHPLNDLDSRIGAISDAGFSGIEFGAVDVATEEGASAVRTLCYKHQIAPVAALALLEEGHEDWTALEASFQPLMETLDGLGAEYLILAPGLLQKTGEVRYGTAIPPLPQIRRIAEEGADLGLKVSFCPHPRNLFPGDAFLESWMTELSPDLLGLAPDFSRITRRDVDSVLPFLLRWKDRVNYLSLPSLSQQPDFPLHPLRDTLEEIHFTGWATVQEDRNGKDQEALTTDRGTLREVFGV